MNIFKPSTVLYDSFKLEHLYRCMLVISFPHWHFSNMIQNTKYWTALFYFSTHYLFKNVGLHLWNFFKYPFQCNVRNNFLKIIYPVTLGKIIKLSLEKNKKIVTYVRKFITFFRLLSRLSKLDLSGLFFYWMLTWPRQLFC